MLLGLGYVANSPVFHSTTYTWDPTTGENCKTPVLLSDSEMSFEMRCVCTIMGGGESRAANSDRGLVLGMGGSRKTGSWARPRRDFFS